jgi:hypothetical protein
MQTGSRCHLYDHLNSYPIKDDLSNADFSGICLKIIRRITDQPRLFEELSHTTLGLSIPIPPCLVERKRSSPRRDKDPERNFLPEPRRGTRISYNIPLTISGFDHVNPFSGAGMTLLVNPQGCAARFGRLVEVGSAVRLEGLPAKYSVRARVVNCIRVGDYEKFWILGLVLDEPGNVWGVESPPKDWLTSTLAQSPITL